MPKKTTRFNGMTFNSVYSARCAVMLDMLGYEIKNKSGFFYVEHQHGKIVICDDILQEKRISKIFEIFALFSKNTMMFVHNSDLAKSLNRLSFYDMCHDAGFTLSEVTRHGKSYKFT